MGPIYIWHLVVSSGDQHISYTLSRKLDELTAMSLYELHKRHIYRFNMHAQLCKGNFTQLLENFKADINVAKQ